MKQHPRTVRIEGDTAFMSLNPYHEAIFDLADLALVQQRTWWVKKDGRIFYAFSRTFTAKGTPTGIRLHRYILGLGRGGIIDHENGNGLDCRRSNLRTATHQQNMQNCCISRNNRSGYKGVFQTNKGKWAAQIMASRKKYVLGTFTTPEAAHAAYCEAAIRLHEEFARFD